MDRTDRMGRPGGVDGMRGEVLARLDHLRERVRALVTARGAGEAQVDHPLRGLYLSHDQAVRMLDSGASQAGASPPQITPLGTALAPLAGRAGLDALDVDILTVACAADVDPSFEKLYGFIHDDLTMRRPTIGLAMRLCGLATASPDRSRFDPGAPLVANALMTVGDVDRPFLGRTLRVPDHVTAFLLQATAVEASVQAQLVPPMYVAAAEVADVLAAIDRSALVHLSEGIGGAAAHVAASAAWAAGRNPVIVDVGAVLPDEIDALVAALIRHRALTGDLLIIRPVEAVAEHAPRQLNRLASGDDTLVLVGTTPFDRAWTDSTPIQLSVGNLPDSEMTRIWYASLGDVRIADDAVDLVQRSFRLTPEQTAAAARSAVVTAADRDPAIPIGFADLSVAARLQSASGIDRLARRLEPNARWDDLILPDDVMTLLTELSVRVRWRSQVMHEWGLGRGWRGQGIAALFAGPSGTGKTTAAEVIAGELGYDIHVVDLSVVVDKYIGETEKKLEVIFTEAERTNTVLLFDEADSIFGKRSEVKDARDRYANIEVSYLLQRIERFAGLAILTTNLGANLDDAFTRRLDAVIDFPRPNVAARERIWRHELRPSVPMDGIDFAFCAEAFELTGGNIRNVVITAAYLAAEARTPVTMREVVIAVQREYRKMGRLSVPAEFGEYGALMT